MSTRVLLIKPPEHSHFDFGTFSLGVLAASIRDIADVTILDATVRTPEEVAQTIQTSRPDIVGITVMGLASVRPATSFVCALRSLLNSHNVSLGTIIAGGHGASMAPEWLLEAGVDAVVIGEGERTLRTILTNGLQPGMQGVVCLDGGRLVAGPPQIPIRPLDSLPLPARDLMPLPGAVHLMETSRGCPHGCNFCEATRFAGRMWRPYSPERVVAEVRRLVEEYDAWVIHFADDNFAASSRRVLEICDLLSAGPLPAFFMASARGDDLLTDPRLIPSMAAAHILRICVGVETVEPELARAAGKPIGLSTYREAFAQMRDYGMFTIASFIVGLPGEHPAMRQRAVDRAIEVGADVAHFLPFWPLPGTPFGVGHEYFEPDPTDIRDAQRMTQEYAQHPMVQQRLTQAAQRNDTRGLLARATLAHRDGT